MDRLQCRFTCMLIFKMCLRPLFSIYTLMTDMKHREKTLLINRRGAKRLSDTLTSVSNCAIPVYSGLSLFDTCGGLVVFCLKSPLKHFCWFTEKERRLPFDPRLASASSPSVHRRHCFIWSSGLNLFPCWFLFVSPPLSCAARMTRGLPPGTENDSSDLMQHICFNLPSHWPDLHVIVSVSCTRGPQRRV